MDKKLEDEKSAGKTKKIDRVNVNIDQPTPLNVLLTNKKSILKDFTFWFSIISLGVSLYTISSTISESKSQNKKWQAINIAKISVIDVKFLIWRKIDYKELCKGDWGYNPTATQYIDEPDYNPNEVLLPYKLVAVNKKTGLPQQSTSSMKISELNQELLSGNLKLQDFDLKKY